MKTSTIVMIGVASVLIISGLVFGYMQQPQQAQTDPMQKSKTTVMEATAVPNMTAGPEQEIMEQKGLYQVYGPDVLESTAEQRRVLFFYASWCPTCQPADKSFATNMDKIPMDTVIIRVNYNDSETDAAEKELAKKYGVTYQHTFVQIDSQGNQVTKWNGGDIDMLLKNLQ